MRQPAKKATTIINPVMILLNPHLKLSSSNGRKHEHINHFAVSIKISILLNKCGFNVLQQIRIIDEFDFV